MIFQHESKDLKKRLRSTEDNIKSMEAENHRFLTILKEVHSKISPILTPQPTTSPSSSLTTATNKTSSEKSGNETSVVNGKSSLASE